MAEIIWTGEINHESFQIRNNPDSVYAVSGELELWVMSRNGGGILYARCKTVTEGEACASRFAHGFDR